MLEIIRVSSSICFCQGRNLSDLGPGSPEETHFWCREGIWKQMIISLIHSAKPLFLLFPCDYFKIPDERVLESCAICLLHFIPCNTWVRDLQTVSYLRGLLTCIIYCLKTIQRLALWHSGLSHCLQYWHPIQALVRVLTAAFPIQLSVNGLRKQLNMAQVLGPLHSHGRPSWSSWFLTLTWSNPG